MRLDLMLMAWKHFCMLEKEKNLAGKSGAFMCFHVLELSVSVSKASGEHVPDSSYALRSTINLGEVELQARRTLPSCCLKQILKPR